jgi:hypothetical protein
MRDREVLVSVARVRNLVALAFITQSEQIRGSLTGASSRGSWRSYGRSGGFGEILRRVLDLRWAFQ